MIEIMAHIGQRGISARGRMRGPTVKIDASERVTIEHAISLLSRRPNFRHVETPWGSVFAVGSDESGETYQIRIDDAKEESVSDDTVTTAWSKGFAAGSNHRRKCPIIESSKFLCDRPAEYEIKGVVVCETHARRLEESRE